MRTPKGWEAREYPVTKLAGRETVAGLVHPCGWLGCHQLPGHPPLYTVDHLPTGARICTTNYQAQAQAICGSLAGVSGMNSLSPPPSICSEAAVIIASVLAKSPERSTPTRRSKSTARSRTSQSSFSPVWTGYVPTPETRAAGQRAAATLGEAWAGRKHPREAYLASERAAAIQWREEIMVRVTQPPRAILLPADIPTLPVPSTASSAKPSSEGWSRPTLLDGTPATPAEFKRRYNLLMELGDRLRAGSRKFLTLHAEGEMEGWTVERLERWERLDERFRALVGEGWMVWSGAAFCLAVNPGLRANVEAKLGFVGGTERGWHDLAIATFLRHPEIAEVRPLRRMMKDVIWQEL
jgi:hypothetical protein